MEIRMLPVIDADELERAVNQQFNCEIKEISVLLFDTDFYNDCYKSFYFGQMEEYKYPVWQNEEEIRLRNLVRAYLQDVIPDFDHVLIDVSW